MPLFRTLTVAAATFAAAHSPAFAQQNWKIASAAQPGSALIGYVDVLASRIPKSQHG